MKKAIVTGAAGFIGFHLCSKLLDEEIDVIGIDSAEDTDRLDMIGRHAGFQFIHEEIERSSLKSIGNGCDAIFHMACSVRPGSPWENIENQVKTHVNRLKRVIDSAKKNKLKIIYPSSYDVYGKRQGYVKETSPKNPENLFGLIKLTEENLLNELCKKHDIPYVILRLPTVYGPWQPSDHTYQQIISSRAAKQPLIIQKDSVTEDALFVEDAVQSLVLAAEGKNAQDTFNIISGENNSWFEGLQQLKVSPQDIPPEKRKMKLSGEKAEKELGFKAHVPIQEGIKKQINHFVKHFMNKSKP